MIPKGVNLVAEVRCPHVIGLAYLTEDEQLGPMLHRLPCPCNDRSDVVRVFAEIGTWIDPKESA